MKARNGLPVKAGTRAVCGASYEDLGSLRRPRTIEDLKAEGRTLQASIYFYNNAPETSSGAFSIWAGNEVSASAGRNGCIRSISISGMKGKAYSLRGEQFSFIPNFSAERKSCLCGEKQALLRHKISGADTEANASAGRKSFNRLRSYLGQNTKSIASAGRKYFEVLPTISGIEGTACSPLGERSAFIPKLSAERKSCLCGEKQALLRHELNTGDTAPCSVIYRKGAERGKKMLLRKIAAAALTCSLLTAGIHREVEASTLSTNFASVYVENLKIGGIYNLTETARYPMWVSYTGDVPVELSFESLAPGVDELKDGYEPIPDPSWITVSRKSAPLLPDETVTVDVTISVPNDEKYLGKKYQAYMLASTVPPKGQGVVSMAFALALKGRILFEIAAKAPTAAELRELVRKKAQESQGVIITPERFMVSVSSSDTQALITQDVQLKLINPSTENVKISIEAVDPQPSGIAIPRGYKTGDLKKLWISKQKFTLKKDGIMSVEMKANFNEKEGEKIFYAVKVIIKSGTLEVSKFVRVYIN